MPVWGFSDYIAMPKSLNIRVDLVERYACGYSKVERSKRMTVLCFAIWCKMQHSNSVMFGMGTRQLMSSLHIGQPKAQLLLNAIKTDELFSMHDDGRFTVASFKDNTRKLNRYGRAYKGANMFTLEVNKEYTIKDIYNRINELLFLRQIGSEEANSSHVSGRNTDKTRSCRSKFITIKQFQEGVGMSHGSVSGIKKRLKNKKEISSTYSELHMADRRIPEQVKKMLVRFGRKNPTFERGDLVYVAIPCSYAITDRKAKKSCGRHIIYGYGSRSKKSQKGTTTACKGIYAPLDCGYGMPD